MKYINQARYLSPSEFAALLGMSVSWVRKKIIRREIETVKFGEAVRIPISEAERLEKEGRRPSVPAARG